MNRTKKIYFLSAIVMIIGCYALNLSYSLFVQTEEKEVVSSTIPTLSSTLSIPTVSVGAKEEYLIKQTISNSSTVSINYGILAKSDGDYVVKVLDKDGNNSYGVLEANSSKDVYLYISNLNDKDITINFILDTTYATLNYDLEKYIENSHIDNINKYTLVYNEVPYANKIDTLAYKVINQYINSGLYSGEKSNPEIDSLLEKTNKVMLPINANLNIKEPDLSSTATAELGLFETIDDYGTSYYFRGAVQNNYVSFANQLWRIVRINGDGSVRLILNSSIGNSTFNSKSDDNAYLGYMYGTPGSYNYDDAHKFIEDKNNYVPGTETSGHSTIKSSLDKYFETNLLNYKDYISDTLFCGNITPLNEELGYGKNNTNYGSLNNNITLECAKDVTNNYSRYTVSGENTNKNISTNGYLSYPIALLSKEELLMAGAKEGNVNNSFYLSNGESFWTMSPFSYKDDVASVVISSGTDSLTSSNVSNSNSIRPVINLKNGVLVTQGTGTIDDPYTIRP